MSLILLQSEKQITPQLKDSSDNPQDFVNIFRKPIEIDNNQTIELVSISYNKQGNITVNASNDTIIFRFGAYEDYLTKNVKLTHGNYTTAAFVIELNARLNNACVLSQYSFSSYAMGTSIYINTIQNPALSIYSANAATNDEDGDLDLDNQREDYPTIPSNVDFIDQTFMGAIEYVNDGYIRNSPITPTDSWDNFSDLFYAYETERGLFSNNPTFTTAIFPQYHIAGLNTSTAIAAPTTFTSGTNTGNLAAYTGTNLYNAQVLIGAQQYYIKYGSDYATSIKDNSGNEFPWFQRGEVLIISTTDTAIPVVIDNTIAANFGLNILKYDNSKAAKLTTLAQDFGRVITSFSNVYGQSFSAITCTDIATYLNYELLGYKNSSVGINRNQDDTVENGMLTTDDDLLIADYSILIEQTSMNLTNTNVVFKAYGKDHTQIGFDSHEFKQFYYTLISGGGEQGPVSSLDLTASGITTSGSSMNNIRLNIKTLAGVKSNIIFSIETSTQASPTMWSPVITGRFQNNSIFTEDFYPLRGMIATGLGSYAQNIGTPMSSIFSGTFEKPEYTGLTVDNLITLGITNTDFAVSESAPIEGNTALVYEKPSFFIRTNTVPDINISNTNNQGTDLSLINIRDVNNAGQPRNNTNNLADVGLILNTSPFTRFNPNFTTNFFINNLGPVLATDYLNENINVQLPDFPIRSFNGCIGQPENCVSIIPAEQIQTDQITGRLYYQASIPNKIDMNNNGKQKINHIRVRLTSPEGQAITNLDHPTSIVLKIDTKK